MPRALLPTGIELEYVTAGDPANPPLLVVNGYTSQLISWPQGYVDQLVAQGLYVIRYDNRDVGLSTKLDGQVVSPGAVLSASLRGEPLPPVPYTLSDMAADGIGLLDHLGIDRAHIVGNSMGGMIVQTMAIEHPDRIASVTSVMSSTGDPRVGKPTDAAREALLAAPPPGRSDYIAASVTSQIWASKKYCDLDWLQDVAAAQYDRCFYPEGATRQLAAIYASGDRSDGLRELDVPMLVIHGRDDRPQAPRRRRGVLRSSSGRRADRGLPPRRDGAARLGPTSASPATPKLVYGRMTGWGQEGPYAQAAGHDINYIALAGALEPHRPRRAGAGAAAQPGRRLRRRRHAARLGVVCALLEAQRSGEGQVVDAAMVDGAAVLMTMFHAFRAMGIWDDERGTNLLDTGAHFYDVYETAATASTSRSARSSRSSTPSCCA
jgi:pimeloyl-ACP methyl ester carboxylesterase